MRQSPACTAGPPVRLGRRLPWVICLLASLGLGGCASLPWNQPKPGDAVPAEALIEMYRLEVVAPSALRPLLTTYLDLARFQRAPVSDQITLAEIDRLAAAARAQARRLVETEGYFNAEVEVSRQAAGADGLPVVRLVLVPGERSVVSEVELAAIGPLKEAADAGDSEATEAIARLRGSWRLPAGAPFRQADWSNAKTAGMAQLRSNGYPTANWRQTSARIDAAANRASLYGLFDSGPLFRFGEMRIEGLQRYQASAVRNLATFRPGSRYSEKAMLDTQERLQRSNLFEGAVVDIDADPASAAAATVLVRVRELPLQQATAGLGYSDATGQRISLEHTHRRIFGRSFFGSDWLARNKFELGRDQQLWEADLITHPLSRGYRHLGSARLLRQDTEGTVVRSSRLRLGRALETERIERLVFAELLEAATRSAAGATSSRALSGNYDWIWRNLDSVLLPTEGLTASIEAALGYAWSNTAANGAFSRLRGRLTAYRPIGSSWYASARLEAGQVFARDAVAVPETLLFRAGGDDSVRGYAYRSLGPSALPRTASSAGLVRSGRVLLTASGELATPISARFPAFWWAVFVDAGQAADRWEDLDLQLGYGVGLRWRSPVGPLRLDLAYAEALRKTRLHLSVGIAF